MGTFIQYSTLESFTISSTCLSMTSTFLATEDKESTYSIMVNVPLFLPSISFQIPHPKYTMP